MFEGLEERTLLSINVTLYRYDAVGSGADPNETVLTPANVVAGSFGKQFTTAVDGQVLAQPLYMSGLNITAGPYAGTHNVVFVATENDSLYAIDAGSGQVLWHDSFLVSTSSVTVTAMPSSDVNSGDITPEIGITGTPAIDAGTGYLFVVAKTKAVYNGDTADPHAVNALYKVNISNGTYTDSVIADTTYSSNGSYTYNSGPYVLGDGDGYVNVGGQDEIYFNSLRQTFRPAVALVNGQVILGSASHGDNGPYHGWMLTYNETTLALTGVLNATPNAEAPFSGTGGSEEGGLGGIWGGGDPIVTDGQGDFYFMTGNGIFDQNPDNFPNPSALTTSNQDPGLPIDGDYGDSFVKVQLDTVHDSQTNQNVNGWGLQVVDYFTPYNQAALDAGDTDLGSGGPTLLPASVGSGAHPNLLVGGGKQGSVYLIDRGTDNSTMTMGEFHNSTDNVVQELANTVGGILSTPAYFNGQVYITSGYGGPIDAFSVSNAQLTADGTTPDNFGNLDGSPVLSADGTANGIVWALERGSGELRAYSAANLSDEIYNSSTLANNADAPGTIMKFTVPMVANGDVYVGTGDSLVMYGLNSPPTTPPAAPSNLIASASGSEVSLSWTNNANNESAFYVYRSTDGVSFSQIGTAGVGQTTYADTTVQPFTSYDYRVAAYNVIGLSAYSNVVNVETAGQPVVGGGDGLLGWYYAGNNSFNTSTTLPTSTPTLARVDPEINFDWNYVGPSTSVGQTDFEVVWTGEVQAQYSEDYTFSTISDDGSELIVNGQPVISDLQAQAPTLDTSSPIALQAGKTYPIELLYFQAGGGAEMYLNWSSPHTPTETIPQSQLFSGSAPAAPSNLAATAISGTQTDLTWTDNSTDGDGYQVDRELGSSGTFSAVAYLPPGSNQYLDTDLTAGNSYTYEVRATNFVADSAWSNQAAVTLPVLPDAVADAMATTVTTTSVSMTWTPEDDNGTAFRIFRTPAGNGGNPIFVTSLPDDPDNPITTYTDAGPAGVGLTPGLMYTYGVQVGNLAGFTAYSQFSVQTLTHAPDELLAVPANGQVTLSWNAPAGAQTFNIYRGTTSGGEDPMPLAIGVTGTSFVDTTVTNGTEYYYQVTAVDTGGESALSAQSSALPQIPAVAPLPPTSVSATPGSTTVVLTWQAAAGASTYNVYRGAASGSEVLLQSAVAAPTYTDAGLTNGVTYYYQVAAVNQAGPSTRSSEVSATPTVATPPTPINVTATAGNGQVSLSWSAASDALTYNIYRAVSSGDEVLYEQGVVGTSYTDTDVTNGVTYYYQVSAGNGVGESNLSQEVSATPLPALPAAPASLTATALSSSQISLSWTESAGTAASFTLERSTNGVNFTPLTTLDGTATSFVDADGFTPGTTYSYELSATNLAGTSAWSNVAATAPLAGVSPPWTDADIGGPTLAGSAYESGGTLVVDGTGSGITGTSDQFHFVYVPFTGNGTIIAQVVTQGDNTGSAKAGVMMRNSLAANSACATMVLTPLNGAAFQSRASVGIAINTTNTGNNTYLAPYWVELVRNGSTFTGYVSANGSTWIEVGSVSLTMNTALYVGLCVTSANTGETSEATFDEISINGSTTPLPPGGLTASPASGTSVGLAWTNNDNLTFANEVYRQDPGSPTFSWIATVPANATSYLDTGLTPGNSYSYQVLASNTVGSTASSTATVTTPVPPLAVSELQPYSIATTSAGLTWVLNSSNDTGVQVWRRAGGAGSFSLVTTLPAGSTDFTDNSLQAGTTYEYHVSAIDLAGASPAADTGLTTLPLPPVVTAATLLGGQVQLSWTASNGAVAYNIYRGLTAGGEGAAPYATVNNGTSFTDAGVTGGQAYYYYYLTAVDFSGESAPSNEVAAQLGVTTATTVSSSQTPAVYGTPLTFTATVTAQSSGTAPNQGSVEFYDSTPGNNYQTLGAGTFVSSSTSVPWTSTWTFTTGVKTFNVASGDVIIAAYTAGTGFVDSNGTTTQTITARGITLTAVANAKTYDGTTSAAATPTMSGSLVGSDTVTGLSETYDNKNVGSGKTLTPVGSVNDGNNGNNYAVTPVTTTGVIFQATLTPSITANGRTYNGGTTVTLASQTVATTFGSDQVSLEVGASSFTSQNAGTETVTATGLSLGGGDAANYTLSSTTASTTAVIAQATLTPSIAANGRTYNGGTTVTLASQTVATTFGSDQVSLEVGASSFTSKSAGTETVTATGLSLGGGDAANYTLSSSTASTTAVIAQATLTPSITANGRTYNGGTTVTLASQTVTGTFGSDVVSLEVGASSFTSKNAGTETVTATGLSLGGNDAANYTLSSTTASSTAIIAQAGLTITAAANTKTYDSTASAAATPTVAGLQGSDTVTGLSETYNNQNAGTGKTLTVAAGYTVNDGNGGANYTVTTATSTAGVINKAGLTITAAACTKTYDTTASATGATPTVTGLLGSDTVTGLSETYNNQNAGTGKTLTPVGSVNDGNGGNNYTLTTVTSTAGVINPAGLTITAAACSKTYDGSTSATTATPTVTGLLGSDTVTGLSETYNNKNVGTGKTLTVAGYTVSDGNSGGNYTVTPAISTAGVITARLITVTAATNTKQYDGTIWAAATPAINSGGLATGDRAAFSETYDNPNVGSGKALTPAGSVNDGNGGNNYTVTFVPNTTGVITARSSPYVNLSNGLANSYNGYAGGYVEIPIRLDYLEETDDSYSGLSAAIVRVTFSQTFSTRRVSTPSRPLLPPRARLPPSSGARWPTLACGLTA